MSPVDTPQTGPAPSLSGRIGTAVGRFTMYRLILLVLAALAAYSLLLNVLGWLTFGIPAMLAHLALCLGLTWAANRSLAAFFRVNPHTESSLITGLLLFAETMYEAQQYLTGRLVDAREAERIGLVFKVLDDAALGGEADRLARMFAQRSPVALAAVKRRVREAMGLSFDEALDAERDAQKTLGHHPDYRAAVTAFMAKTNPTFQERK